MVKKPRWELRPMNFLKAIWIKFWFQIKTEKWNNQEPTDLRVLYYKVFFVFVN